MEPNQEHLKLWVEDLESGQHTQIKSAMGHSYQGKDSGYCCLGRLCEVAMANGVGVHRTLSAIGDGLYILYDGESGSYVPPKVSDWLGIDSYKLSFYAAMNDGGKTFDQIAAMLRRKYL